MTCHFLRAGIVCCLAVCVFVFPAHAQPAPRPNIVILLADDLGYGDLQSYGHPTIQTPEIDRMADEGLRLTSFYAGAPVCTPSRAALMTGRYPVRFGQPGNWGPDSKEGLPTTEITMAEALKGQGYRTMAIGKWHLGSYAPFLPTSNGFDQYFGLLYSNDMIRPWVQTDRPLELYRDDKPVEHVTDQADLMERYTGEAVKFVKAGGREPFFLYLAYHMPHLPISTGKRFQGQSRAGFYGDVIETIDWSVGEILKALKEQGFDENTLVVFTSDNGPWQNLPSRMLQGGNERWHSGSAGPLRGSKATTYEGGLRVPAVFRWPGRIPGGRVSAEIAALPDLYVTALKLAGAAAPQDRPLDSNDLMPFLTEETDKSPTERVHYFGHDQLQAIREGRWKLRIARGKDTGEALPDSVSTMPELYDLEVDPAERYNVAERHPEVVQRLAEEMRQFATEVGAVVVDFDLP